MKRFKDLPEHTQLYLSALLADVNYLKGFANNPVFEMDKAHYEDARKNYEAACKRLGVNPYSANTSPDLCYAECQHPDGYIAICLQVKDHPSSHGDNIDYWNDGDTTVSIRNLENELVQIGKEEQEEGSSEERGTTDAEA